MTTSIIQLKANQSNAKKSTGAKTSEGKSIVAKNALKHGVFAKQLVLSDENPEDYQQLFDELQIALNPVGALEYSLVERVAVTLWRQRRLIRSETAHIQLSNKDSVIASAINSEMNWKKGSDQEVMDDELTDFDQVHYQWCQSICAEYKAITADEDAIDNLLDLEFLKQHAPKIYENLQEAAELEGQTIDECLQSYDTDFGYFTDVIHYCYDEIDQAKQRPLVLEIAQIVRNKRAVLQQGLLRDALAKYQIMLDNELYKAIKALRETQAWRLDSL
jgi:hypothetical protein